MSAALQACEGAGHAAFHRSGGELHIEGVAASTLAARYGTPLYVYSAAALADRAAQVRAAFPGALVCYAMKANSNLALLARMHAAALGFDVVSGGELARLTAAGVPTNRVVFAGVGKEPWELDAAMQAGIAFFNVESPHELHSLSAAGQRAGRAAAVALRINPDVDAGTHAYIATGKQNTKFGIALDHADAVVRRIQADPHLRLVGYHVHLGSQLRSAEPYAQALSRVEAFVDGSSHRGAGITHYDLGGGFGISYGKGAALDPAEVARALLPRLQRRNWQPVVEPGRFLVGDAGALLTRVIGSKTQGNAEFVLVDAAMNDLLRPALYGAEHPIVACQPRSGALRCVDVVGPVCETGDFLGKQRELPPCAEGDLLAVLAAGAYGSAMASNYNTRRRPAEVLVEGAQARLIRRRETFADLLAPELELHEP